MSFCIVNRIKLNKINGFQQSIMEDLIKQHFDQMSLDIRKQAPGYYRFMDQKVTPDVLQFVSECIITYTGKNPGCVFSAPEIEHSQYFIKNVTREFSKPAPGEKSTDSEYDKWPAQIIQALRFAGVIEEQGKKGRAVGYVVLRPDILEYIAERSQNAYAFLFYYIVKVLSDSGFYNYIEQYRDRYLAGSLDKTDFCELKQRFESFMIGHTRIKGRYEPRRIFPKVLNILASEYRIPGSVSGKMSKFPFMTSDLIYNRVNFRDKNKSKSVSRQEQQKNRVARQDPIQRISAAKKRIKELHSQSKVQDQWATGEATQVHHIFPENEFPQLADRLENLIRLTPTQHNTKAHPHNKTGVIDCEYQFICLIEKSHGIERSLEKGEFDYSRESFVGVINTGLKQNLSYASSFEDIRASIKRAYRG